MKSKYRIVAEGEKTNGCIFYKKSESNNYESALSMYEKIKRFAQNHNLSVTVTLLLRWGNVYCAEKSEIITSC